MKNMYNFYIQNFFPGDLQSCLGCVSDPNHPQFSEQPPLIRNFMSCAVEMW